MQRSCSSTTSGLIYCWEAQTLLKPGWKGNLAALDQSGVLEQWDGLLSTSVGFWRGAERGAGGKGWTLGAALLSSASLGVFDKLTLCTLSVGLSLSNTRSATLQLPGHSVLAGCQPGRTEGKEAQQLLLTSEAFFQLAKSLINPPIFPPAALFFGEDRKSVV